MNIFYLSHSPIECARQQCDKHVVKMPTETAQLLSTAHRVLDGTLEIREKKRYWIHPLPSFELNLYKASHVNHPDGIWLRQTRDQYMFAYWLWEALVSEYQHRYGRIHATTRLRSYLSDPPSALIHTRGFVEPPQCMPNQYKLDGQTIAAYRSLYVGEKIRFARYTNREAPDWFKPHLEEYHRETGVIYERTCIRDAASS